MSEEFSDDFVIEEEETSNRSFLIAAGSLIGVFIIISACVLAYFLIQRGDSGDDSAAETIVAANATTLAENALVTRQIEAIETEAARPTSTSEPVPTIAPTNTPRDTSVETGTIEGSQPEAEVTNTPDTAMTETAEAGGDADGTATVESGGSDGTNGEDGTGGAETLPETGVSAWGFALLALGLLALLLVARRLRVS